MDRDGVLEHLASRRAASRHPLVVGISGYAGSGESTMARYLAGSLPGAVRLRGDDLLDPTRSHQRSSNWDGADRTRLVAEALDPLATGAPAASAASTGQHAPWPIPNHSPAPICRSST